MTTQSDLTCETSDHHSGRRGLLPEPRVVDLGPEEFEFDGSWRTVDVTRGRAGTALEAFEEYLGEYHGHRSGAKPAPEGEIVLVLDPARVVVDGVADPDIDRVTAQAYELRLAPDRIQVTAAAEAGLFYGMVTLVQLVEQDRGRCWLPAGVVRDWPNVGRRYILWDDSEHLDRMETLRAAVRQAGFYKVNGFVLKLDSHFQFASAPEVVDPHALFPAELQELTSYGLRYHVQVIPYLDAPGHLAWLLKHPEYADLRELPQCNYQLCTTDPRACEVVEGLVQDLVDANQGVDYFVLSTDEPYYIGAGRSRQRLRELGSAGRVEAEFISRIAGYLRRRGRTVQFWGEYPIERDDIAALPPDLVNGVTTGPKYDPVYACHGIRQLVYASTQAELPFFPDYDPLPPSEMVNPTKSSCALVRLHRDVSTTPAYRQGNVVGAFVAAWSDGGLHPETFWLGFVCGASWAWHPGRPEPAEALRRFGTLFYGPGAVEIPQIYSGLSRQAQFSYSSWDSCPSTARSPIVGDSYGIFPTPRPARDQTLPLPEPLRRDLAATRSWREAQGHRVGLARLFATRLEGLLAILEQNRVAVRRNRHNIEVLRAIAGMFLKNLDLLQDLARADDELRRAEASALEGEPEAAVAAVDCALTLVQAIRRARDRAYLAMVAAWTKSRHPKSATGNGRRIRHVFDDVKDHLPDRTVDLSYLIQRQLLLPLDAWFERVRDERNRYAQEHGVPARHDSLNWSRHP